MFKVDRMPVVVRGNGTASMSQVREIIMDQGQRRAWVMSEVAPGHIFARYHARMKHSAEIDIRYDRTYYSIQYRRSDNLGYSAESGTIHNRYNLWVRTLNQAITLAFARVEVRPEPAGAAQPSPTAPSPMLSTDVVLNLVAGRNAGRPSDWPELAGEWQKQAPGAIEAAGGRLLGVQLGEPKATGAAGTLLVVIVNSYRYIPANRRLKKDLIDPDAHLNLSVRSFDLQTGKALGTERFYTASSEDAADFKAELSEQQMRTAATAIIADLRKAPAMGPFPADLAPPPAPAKGSDTSESEVLHWQRVRDSKDPAQLRSYLDRYPSGIFAPLARSRLAGIEK